MARWAHFSKFFHHSAAKHTFALLDHRVFIILWKWAKRRHPNKSQQWIKDKYFKTIGNKHWVFSTTDKKQTWGLPLFSATKIIRHTKIRCLSNPYDKDWEIYFKERDKKKFANYKSTSKVA